MSDIFNLRYPRVASEVALRNQNHTLRTRLAEVEAERDRYKLALNRLLVDDHVGTPINHGCGAMNVIEDALSWTDAEVEQFMKEWDEGKHRLSPEDEKALESMKPKLFKRIRRNE